MARGKSAKAATPTVTDEAARVTIAEALLDGMPPETLVEQLISSGRPASSARFEVDRAVRSPYLRAAERLRARIAKRDWTLSIAARLHELRDDADVVPVVDSVDPARFYADFYIANRPVKLTGLVDDWPAMTRWSFDYFDAMLGDALIEVQDGREANPDFELAKDTHRRQARLRDVTARLRTERGNDLYVTAFNSTLNKTALAPLWADTAAISILAPAERRDGFIWMGPAGTITPFHHDLTNNLLLQIVGRKRVKLVAAADGARMRNDRHCFSGWSGEELPAGPPDNERPRVIECTIGPGEAVFLPVGWWHHVEGLDATIGMSFTNFNADNDFYSSYRSHEAV